MDRKGDNFFFLVIFHTLHDFSRDNALKTPAWLRKDVADWRNDFIQVQLDVPTCWWERVEEGLLARARATQADTINGVPTLSTFLFLSRLCAAGEGVQGVVAEISDEALRPSVQLGKGSRERWLRSQMRLGWIPLHLYCCDKYLAENSVLKGGGLQFRSSLSTRSPSVAQSVRRAEEVTAAVAGGVQSHCVQSQSR